MNILTNKIISFCYVNGLSNTIVYNAPNTFVFAHQTLVFHLWQLNKTQCKRLLINTHLLAHSNDH